MNTLLLFLSTHTRIDELSARLSPIDELNNIYPIDATDSQTQFNILILLFFVITQSASKLYYKV